MERSELELPVVPHRLGPLRPATLLARPNRYVAQVAFDNTTAWAHVPDPGRLPDLMWPGNTVYIAPNIGAHYKTSYTLFLARAPEPPHILVSVDTQAPNRLAAALLAAGFLQDGSDPWTIRREVTYGHSRFDFQLARAQEQLILEVKSVTLALSGVAYFPDAPTARGTKHLQTLSRLARRGMRTAVLFVVQRSDAGEIRPNTSTDPAFAKALASAQRAGVELYGVRFRVELEGFHLEQTVPVRP
ncbi:MAG: DNA/RNA nuclease SfsA [Deinococcus sp.]|nr:DNA/RNA nuclease SfsA [Deinococcus sp.]